MHSPGITLYPIKQISGSQHFTETEFDEVFVPDFDRLGAEGEGWSVAMTILKHERGTVEAAARYIEIRADMDLLLGCCAAGNEYRELLDEFDIRVELVRAQVQKAVERESDDLAFLHATAGLKVIWSDLWKQITDLSAKLTCPTHRQHWRHQYLESRSASIYSGTNEIQRNIIAERVLGLPK
jgi:alkylation response protein AidB-like acyl-CoA dehydrogenase